MQLTEKPIPSVRTSEQVYEENPNDLNSLNDDLDRFINHFWGILDRKKKSSLINEKKKTVFIFLPFARYTSDSQPKPGGCLFFFIFADESDLIERLERFKGAIYYYLAASFEYESMTAIERNIITEARIAAIAQVMIRNMSHNIGSHVLNKLKDRNDILNTINYDEIEILRKGREPQIERTRSNSNQYLAENLNLSKEGLSCIDKIAYFNQYLKNRMDFLADVATSNPAIENPLYFRKEILSGLDKNRILLDRISGISENIKYDFHIRRKKNDSWEDLQEFNDLLISVPNDILGNQAFYIIIENLIRNIVKHSKISNREWTFLINIDIEDCIDNNNFYEVSVYDNILRTETEINELVRKRNEAFNEPILSKETNQLRGENLGTIEMEVCAAYLRKLPFEMLEEDIYRIAEEKFNVDNITKVKVPNLIRAFSQKHLNEQYSLGYKLFLRKPKSILIIDNSGKSAYAEEALEKLHNNGIWIFSQEEINVDKNYEHDFLIWCEKQEELLEFIRNQNGGIPKRIFSKIDFPDESFKINIENPEETIKFIWIKYAKKMLELRDLKFVQYEYQNEKTIFPVSTEIDGKQLNVFFDSHGNEWNKKDDDLYYELTCSHHRFSSMEPHKKHYVKRQAEYCECILSTVMIIDERLQDNIVNKGKKYNSKIPFQELFKKQGILIPSSSEVNLNLPNFGIVSEQEIKNNRGSEADKIVNFINSNINKFDFCVIHLGILEKMLAFNVDKSKKEIEDLINKIFNREQRKKLIVTSGRGKPHNIPQDISFLSLSILQNAVEILFDKFLLVKLLYNSRRLR